MREGEKCHTHSICCLKCLEWEWACGPSLLAMYWITSVSKTQTVHCVTIYQFISKLFLGLHSHKTSINNARTLSKIRKILKQRYIHDIKTKSLANQLNCQVGFSKITHSHELNKQCILPLIPQTVQWVGLRT